MLMHDVADVLPVTPAPSADWQEAARLLEQAVRAGSPDPQAAYLLAMAYKRLGRIAEARQTLARIADADANVLLQRGILAYADRDFEQAAQAFTQSWDLEPASYPAAYNLMLAQLCQGRNEPCVALIGKLIPLAEASADRRFLALLRALLIGLLASAAPTDGASDVAADLSSMTPEEEARLVTMLAGLGSFAVAFPLLNQLMTVRKQSPVAFRAYFGAALLQGKLLMDRFQWQDAHALLASLARNVGDETSPRLRGLPDDDNSAASIVVLYNMLGTCSCMLQEYERGAWHFRNAQEAFHRGHETGNSPGGKKRNGAGSEASLSGPDILQAARLEQNLALAFEWQNKLDKAEDHWSRYFDYLDQCAAVPLAAIPVAASPEAESRSPPYEGGAGGGSSIPTLAFEALSRLADLYTKKEKWSAALGFLRRAQRLRPADNDLLERLFQLYTQLKKKDEAKRLLRRLRELRPNDPQIELFEIDVRDFRMPEDIDKTLGDIRRILQTHAGDMRIEERAGVVINNLVPALERLGEQYTGQINKVIEQMRRLPSYQINWPLVRNVMRELEDKFFQLRRVAQKCLGLLTSDDLRRDINSLVTHCDHKIDQCHSIGE